MSIKKFIMQMSTKGFGIVIAVVVIVGGAFLLFSKNNNAVQPTVPVAEQSATPTIEQQSNPTPSTIANTPTPTIKVTPTLSPTATPPATNTYSMAMVAKHGGSSSCWTAINGKVYDLTAWIGQHPGGPVNI